MKISKEIKKYVLPVLLTAALLLSAITVLVKYKGTSQAVPAMTFDVAFLGEYKIADGEFRPIVQGESIPANKGDVTLRGGFYLRAPDGEIVGRVSEGYPIYMYLNHIGVTVYVPSQEPHILDSENPAVREDSCGENWLVYEYTGTDTDTVEILLHNPHSFGNPGAYDEFLGNMYIYSGVQLENILLGEGAFEREVGYFFSIVSLVIIGIALYSLLLHLKHSALILNYGIITLLAGICFIFGSKNISLWNDIVVFNTTAYVIAHMLYELFLESLAVSFLTGKRKAVGTATVCASALSMCVLVVTSMLTDFLIYDAQLIWGAIQSVIIAVVLVLIILNISGKKSHNIYLLLPCEFSIVAYYIDFAATLFGWWSDSVVAKIAFIVLFLTALIMVLRVLPKSIRAAASERELIAERNQLQAELQNSRVSIMLSQIRPHFVYNVLNTIHYLCGKDPDVAQDAISTFSDYLRNKLDSVNCNELVAFDTELQHINTYLKLEKIRFGDELSVVFDIQATGFCLPVLTVQPLVENAVKHGVSKKRGGGTVNISTKETNSSYKITVSDDGTGLDTKNYAKDGKVHIGIENIRQRLQSMCYATLEIFSEVGKGTTAIITIPKKEADCIENISRRR